MKKLSLTLLFAFCITHVFSQQIRVSGWSLLNPYGIDKGNNHWEAGRVNDVLEIDGANNQVLVAADMGGIWWLRSGGNWGVSLSNTWKWPDMTSLAKGVSQGHIIAGGANSLTGAGVLYQTNFTSSASLLNRWIQIPAPWNMGRINKLFVHQASRRLLVAAQNGLWWSSIPATPDSSLYSFVKINLPSCDRGVFDIAETSNNNFIISLFAGACSGGNSVLFNMSFNAANQPVFNPVTITGISPADRGVISTVSVASCKNQKQFVYAAMAKNDGTFMCILKSEDGGRNFRRLSWQPPADPGAGIQGVARDNCIAVHNINPAIVAMGWVTGPYISTNGGDNFMMMPRHFTHDDKSALEFSDKHPDRLYICSDGGLATANNINAITAANMDYTWSRRLANLQFTDPAMSRWGWWGRFDIKQANSTVAAGGGLQDNNNVHMESSNAPWKVVESGFDGGGHIYLRCGGFIWSNGGRGLRYRGNDQTDHEILIKSFAPGSDQRINSLSGFYCEIPNPQKRNLAGQRMYAVATHQADTNLVLGQNSIYGIFANTDGTEIHAEYLFTTSGAVEVTSAISSDDGIEIFVGKRPSGRIIKYISGAGNQPYSAVEGRGFPVGGIGRYPARTIDVNTSSDAYSLVNYDGDIGKIYYTTNGSDWNDITGNLPSGIIYSIDLFKNACRHVLFAVMEDKVYACANHSGNWVDISAGLPVRAHGCDIQVVENIGCTTDIYLSTTGWSVWKCSLLN